LFRRLASGVAAQPWAALSEFEFGLIVAGNAFGRWVVRCMAAAGMPDLTLTDVLVLHHVQPPRPQTEEARRRVLHAELRGQPRRELRAEEVARPGLAEHATKQGKEVFYSTTERARVLVEKYQQVRDRCLLPGLDARAGDAEQLAHTAQLLRSLSGLYDQAARAATSL
jgi:predicted MarR family transcription regulator